MLPNNLVLKLHILKKEMSLKERLCSPNEEFSNLEQDALEESRLRVPGIALGKIVQ